MSLDNMVKGSYGQFFEVTIVQDRVVQNVSSYSESQTFVFRTPGREQKEIDGRFSSDGTDGKVGFLVGEDDFDEAGIWRFRVALESSTRLINTVSRSFKVRDGFE